MTQPHPGQVSGTVESRFGASTSSEFRLAVAHEAIREQDVIAVDLESILPIQVTGAVAPPVARSDLFAASSSGLGTLKGIEEPCAVMNGQNLDFILVDSVDDAVTVDDDLT